VVRARQDCVQRDAAGLGATRVLRFQVAGLEAIRENTDAKAFPFFSGNLDRIRLARCVSNNLKPGLTPGKGWPPGNNLKPELTPGKG
jgi:hypothetical protein